MVIKVVLGTSRYYTFRLDRRKFLSEMESDVVQCFNVKYFCVRCRMRNYVI